MLVSSHALPNSMPYRHQQMVQAAATRRLYQPQPAPAPKAEPHNSHIDALIAQDYGYVRPWWEVYGDTPTPSQTELGRLVRYSDSPAALRFRSHHQAK